MICESILYGLTSSTSGTRRHGEGPPECQSGVNIQYDANQPINGKLSRVSKEEWASRIVPLKMSMVVYETSLDDANIIPLTIFLYSLKSSSLNFQISKIPKFQNSKSCLTKFTILI